MLVITAQDLIKTLQTYNPEELLMVTWWSTEDVEMLMTDDGIDDADKAKDIWDDIVFDLDTRTSDHAISSVNDELSTMVYEKLEEK